MEKHLEQFKQLIEKGDEQHGTPYKASNKGVMSFSEGVCLTAACKKLAKGENLNLTVNVMSLAAKYAGETITIKLGE